MLTKEEASLKLPSGTLIILSFVPDVSVTVRISNVFTSGADLLGWMQVVYNDAAVDGDSGDSPSCLSDEDMVPGASLELTGECIDGVAVFDLFVYDDSDAFDGLTQSDDLGCSFLSTDGGSSGGIAYYSFMVGCSGDGGLCDLPSDNQASSSPSSSNSSSMMTRVHSLDCLNQTTWVVPS